MSSEPISNDPQAEYAALLRAAAARLALEQSFGIESWKLPSLLPEPAAARTAPSPRPAPGGRPAAPAKPRKAPPDAAPPRWVPAAPPPSAPEPAEPPVHVATKSSVNLFDAKDYDIEIPDGLPKQGQLDHFAQCIADCTLCPLHQGRTQVVFGVGNPDADLMFIGEAPGHDEDVQGIPFVGRAGQLLTKIIEAMGFTRDEVYIANINKCRPPNNRAPLPDEMARCLPFLLRQIDIIQPRVICLLGATAVKGLLQLKQGITSLRGTFLEWRGLKVMPTYHPAYLLRNPAGKRDVWEDVQKVRDAIRGT